MVGDTLTPEVLSYVAGFMDGEGCFLYDDSPRVIISNTFLPVLLWMKSLFGGSIYTDEKRRSHHRAGYTLRFSGNDAIAFGWVVGPYLLEKHDQWSCMLDIRSTLKKDRGPLLAELKSLKRREWRREDK